MFIRVSSFTIQADGQIERRAVDVPAVIKPAPIVVRVVDEIDRREAVRLLRRFLDELEANADG